jgi:hypothetical protein
MDVEKWLYAIKKDIRRMYAIDIVNALFYFYALLFSGTLVALLIGLRLLYVAVQRKDSELMRKAKFVLLFAAIAMLCIAIVSFFVTGKLPVD